MERQQAKKKHFIPLTLKLALAVIASLIAAFIIYEVMNGLEALVAQKYYLSEEATARNVNNAFRDFEDFVAKRHIKSTDTEQLQSWVKDHDYTNLTIFDNYSISFDGGWAITGDGSDPEGVSGDQTEVDHDELQPRITPETFQQDLKNRIIALEDGSYYVYINVYREQHLYRIFSFLEIAVCVAVVLLALLIYNA